jgi:hypothetical protein
MRDERWRAVAAQSRIEQIAAAGGMGETLAGVGEMPVTVVDKKTGRQGLHGPARAAKAEAKFLVAEHDLVRGGHGKIDEPIAARCAEDGLVSAGIGGHHRVAARIKHVVPRTTGQCVEPDTGMNDDAIPSCRKLVTVPAPPPMLTPLSSPMLEAALPIKALIEVVLPLVTCRHRKMPRRLDNRLCRNWSPCRHASDVDPAVVAADQGSGRSGAAVGDPAASPQIHAAGRATDRTEISYCAERLDDRDSVCSIRRDRPEIGDGADGAGDNHTLVDGIDQSLGRAGTAVGEPATDAQGHPQRAPIVPKLVTVPAPPLTSTPLTRVLPVISALVEALLPLVRLPPANRSTVL